MDVYRSYLAQLNRRILLASVFFFVFWLEHSFLSVIPETTGWLQFIIVRVTSFLSFLAWPFFFLAVIQLLINRFMLYGYDGEVRPKSFSYELTGFFKKYYLNIVMVGLVLSLIIHIGSVSDMGLSEWAKDTGVTPFEKALLIVVNLFTLHTIVSSFESSGPLVGLSLVLCYFVFAFLSEW